jgi:hyperosmotically inducible protein
MKHQIANFVVIVCLALLATTTGVGCAGDRYSRSTGEYIDDEALTAKVKSAMVADKRVSALDVKVKIYQGLVQLSGFVNTQAQKDAAEEIARTTKGVKSVKNDIVVK